MLLNTGDIRLSLVVYIAATLLLHIKGMFTVNNSNKITVSLVWLVFLVAYIWAPVTGAKSYIAFVVASAILYAGLDYYYGHKLNFQGYLAYMIASFIGIAVSVYLYAIF